MMKKLTQVTIAAALALSVAACTTTDPYTGQSGVSNTAAGVGIGALGGAVVGAIAGGSDHRAEGALIGAAAGGLVGGGIGAYMDQQEAKLRQQLQASGVSVTRSGNDIILNMPNDVTFGTNEVALSGRAMQVLSSVALVGKEFDRTRLNVLGHTDNTGSESYNIQLSQRRANSVSGYLMNQGIAPQRLTAYGYGFSRPIATNNTEQGRAQNRRVEIVLTPL
ncbi:MULTISPECIES: OmpA family protein [Pseudovibrio]|uniref:OmpA family protein n=1 Tax=Stappiaceae TaxID=2821832 RepID=UPI002365581D|nr:MULTISPECIES: OmpA family protein [Pseudovibrio]MDD7908937.1 OmpA family protein [Pseudovibrio exalbescens]MDX5593742.1 OmpA family protein [Pseudovibrio sp. SPO723]